ncbi:MAG: PBP1A family penicillin-binding protein [candidate division Zixibacteria bacterium]|nr:PBP1A family penicillin-binding protein [candidate division Zixibacteria bacterium]
MRISQFCSSRKKLLILSGAILFVLVLLFAAIIKTYNTYKKDLPSLTQLHNIEPSLITKIYSADGEVIKEFYTERRILTPLKRIPPHLIDALLATEDRRFFDHWGANLLAMGRALWHNFWAGRRVQGASTITQQLARTLFLTPEKTIPRKIKEVLTAIKIERNYTKEEILEMYLNQCYFGRGAYGVQAAAHLYFGKNVEDLIISECAILIGIPKNPSRYSPITHPDLSLKRRNIVLESTKDFGRISTKLADSLKSLPLEIHPTSAPIGEAPYFTEMVRQYLEKKYGEDGLYQGGLSVYTTLNLELQMAAEEALIRELETRQQNMEQTHSLQDTNYTVVVIDTTEEKPISKREYKQIQGALVALDNKNGNILALVGGKDFAQSQFNRAVQALRQPGSGFKPFIYTAAIDNGARPTDIVYDTPIILTGDDGKEWGPQNFDLIFRGPVTLREALARSINVVSAKLIQKVTPQQTIFFASHMGISSPLAPYPSLALGTSEVTLWDMVSAFSVFPHGGIKVEPKYILKITDRYGKVLEEKKFSRREEVLSAQTAYIMITMLQSVINRGTGYGARARGFTRPAGGKTGTSDDCMDNWFLGFTPQITAGVWIGYDDKTVIGENVTGAHTALPVWTDFMIKAHGNLPVEYFKLPPGIYFKTVCLESGLPATDKCPRIITDIFTEETLPEGVCDLHPSDGIPDTTIIELFREREQLPEKREGILF